MSKPAPAEQSGGLPGADDLQRNLSNRHIQLIAIGGAIGTGLFMGSGKTISLAGPSILSVIAATLSPPTSMTRIWQRWENLKACNTGETYG